MSAVARNQVFSAVHTIGGLLPADMLVRISEGKDVQGCQPADYRVIGSRSVRDDAERHWDYLKSIWADLREQLPAAPEADTPADPTGLAAAQWLLPLFHEFGFGELITLGSGGITSDDDTKTFAVSHRWNHVPVHLTAWSASLDKRPGGAGTVPPQSLVQELLNRTDSHLWGVLTNGRQLRLLRDSSALATASYVEFDLEAIFDGELFSEFVLLYRLLHVTRFAVAEGAAPSTCWLEKWRIDAIASGTRALNHLRDGVQQAITTLGTGFLKHPDNAQLRETLDVHTFHAALLRLVYRLIFLFVAEDRGMLHPPETTEQTRRRYATYFSSARLRRQANYRRGTAHTDLHQALQIVLDALGRESGRPELGLPGLGGLFDQSDADAPLQGMSLANSYLLEAVRHLSRVRDDTRWRAVNYRGIGAEELGSVYESLLELVPKHSAVDSRFELISRMGNDRKKTGSYYTPASLIETLLDATLDPVIDDAQKLGEQKASAAGFADPAESIVAELLSLTVCDPACGSGHFLVAAARRIAKRVAAVREGNPEPTIEAVEHALREVVARCIYGVDLNPMAVELAKIALWLESLEAGKALGFLDAHIKRGNGLIGATPALLRSGIPSTAFKPVEGDDKSYAGALGKQNDQERLGQHSLFDLTSGTKVANATFASSLRRITAGPSDTLAEIHRQEDAYRGWESSAEYSHARHVADAWCAAFMWHKTKTAPPAITHDVFRALQDPDGSAALQATHDEIVRLREQYQFFHWHLAFPDVFTVTDDGSAVDTSTGWTGGFSCALGNPPWDRLEFEDKKYFSVAEPSIAEISGIARERRIEKWESDNPEAGDQYRVERRKLKATSFFAAASGTFSLCARGLSAGGVTKLQVDQLFVEQFCSITRSDGRIGCIIPTAIATSAGAQYLFADFTRRGAVKLLYDFENRSKIFESVHSSQKFCLLSLTGIEIREPEAEFAFFLSDTSDLDDPSRVFTLAPEEIHLLSPNTGSLPIFRSRRDAELTIAIYRILPVLSDDKLINGGLWNVDFKYLFRNANDGDLLFTREQLISEGWELHHSTFMRGSDQMLPLYEAKMVDFFNHRAADVIKSPTAVNRQNQPRYLTADELRDPSKFVTAINWVDASDHIKTRRKGKNVEVPGIGPRLREVKWEHDWLCGWCDVTASTNERTSIPAFIPRTAVVHTFPLMFPHVPPTLVATLVAAQSSLVFDYVSRQKIGGIHMALMTWKQLPVPTPEMMEPHTSFITPRVLELVYTAYDMSGLARDLGDEDAPFQWIEERRVQMRAELDAYFFHLYGIDEPDVDYILETFQSDSGGGLKNNEIAKYGSYRTKDLILAEYDRMSAAGLTLTSPLVDGENYTSTLTPPPGHGPRHPAATITGEET
ncbi:restriction endonuclease [Amycolatopsis sp. WAC 01416]|uniref:Eco57I restriction-modification methylase domain-containing protein n=1 Tax=Amycolatopsis sp. WAC 01416 TaxID=2203196 RepID=UPI000F771AFB|nr:DNA methyltransferase [Amycolatopsis sp. WAC 01416]RSN31737.1 restriction endonuclease [Amycolatopsis sp. WAC 01416]